jgi:hypothetical protein
MAICPYMKFAEKANLLSKNLKRRKKIQIINKKEENKDYLYYIYLDFFLFFLVQNGKI